MDPINSVNLFHRRIFEKFMSKVRNCTRKDELKTDKSQKVTTTRNTSKYNLLMLMISTRIQTTLD